MQLKNGKQQTHKADSRNKDGLESVDYLPNYNVGSALSQ